MSKFKIELIVKALATGKHCHRQCQHLVDMMDDEGRFVCSAFDYRLLNMVGNKKERCPECLGAQKRLEKVKASAKRIAEQPELLGL